MSDKKFDNILVFILVLAILFVVIECRCANKDKRVELAPTETTTRFTMEIEDRDTALKMSRVVECMRQESHVLKTSTTAC